ncbi:MAG: methionine adenosyltransferase [Lentisphaerae bacterium]|jgi:S-adenosylmethionine synthetase|nr:methionine adenosyltransferase [Kiritimatiellia bacterium]MDD4442369.1 methionine adenosyltransferase [Kiritimatiellia bacterium]MDX9795103.1 methionine adenosyltransferase [Kiritimatiellia bacterium]NLC83028.1 methionine adenosyltransferase [Lentisphaerota bacterium]
MSKMMTRHVYTSESVSEGHPDKVCDQISDAILDACLANDSAAHVACETAVGSNLVVNVGEITCKNWDRINPGKIARDVVQDIGYDTPSEGFSFDTFNYVCALHGQSVDIARGVNKVKPEDQGAGDQGMMFGYASNATRQLMPAPIIFSHSLLQFFTTLRKNGEIAYLRPDSKAQVSVLHENGDAKEITAVVISHQTREVPITRIRKELEEAARAFLKDTGMLTNKTKFYINPTGRFVVGGPCGDSGVTGRKIIVDTYGGVGSHGGGAFSGKDPSKVDRSAAYYCRYAAKNIVAAGLADKCEIQVAYAIGVAKPLSINVSTYGTGRIDDEKIAKILTANEIFDFRPGMLIKDLGLTRPKGWSYRKTSNYGHFGRDGFPWEKTDRVAALRSASGLK